MYKRRNEKPVFSRSGDEVTFRDRFHRLGHAVVLAHWLTVGRYACPSLDRIVNGIWTRSR
jgi:hypothetical protein